MKRFPITCLGIVLLLPLAWNSAAWQARVITFAVDPTQPLMDDRLGITISGLPPNQLITLSAKSEAKDHLWWHSTAVFSSGPNGTIDLRAQAPVSGLYQGVDGMGLFWSMKPDTATMTGDHHFFAVADWPASVIAEIEATYAGRLLGSARIERRYAQAGIHRTEIAEAGIVGFLYDPGDGRPHPGVIVLGGSEGGFGLPNTAMLLASHGFTALSLAYFGVKGLPSTLQNVPLEYFEKAVQWMRARWEVDHGLVSVFGTSRGAEAALLVAAADPHVKAVVAVSPSHVPWEGVTAKHLPGGPAWTSDGKPLPYVPNRIPFAFAVRYAWGTLAGYPVQLTPLFIHDLNVFGDTTRIEIPVERIRGPVLLLSGKDDQTWPSSFMATRLVERLRRHQHPYRDEYLSYDGVGHWIPNAYVPTNGSRRGMTWAIGGTPEATALALADSWPKILRFLIGASVEQKGRVEDVAIHWGTACQFHVGVKVEF